MLNAQGDILERNAYYPFGLQMNQGKAYPTLSERLPQLYSGYISQTPARRDLYNGKEIQTTAGTDYIDYGFRQYDPVTARWMAVDPKAEEYMPLTLYNYCAENPIRFIDFAGDSIVIDDYGYLLHYQQSDPDLRVFMNGNFIGFLGGVIYADNWFSNLLARNMGEMINSALWDFFLNVKKDSKWDYKYRSPKNKDLKTNEQHILGIAFQRKDKDKGEGGIGDLGETRFIFNGERGRSEDLNNFHYGVIGTAIGIDPFVLLYGAGYIEKQKQATRYKKGLEESPLVPENWRPEKKLNFMGFSINVPMPPFGDNPLDFAWIVKGMQFFNTKARQ